ncbi:heavy-metal-associated domain-containing protein [Massilia sp. TSP1-1-2]|uniref:heavy-metal-associated domain-containing protein n=1 Tax=Massilia sp. TSP1-1-2 TaxID=2804649 RepID=UPI003CEFC73C
MKSIIAIALLAASLSAQAAQSLKAEVNGMVCAFCAQGIEKKLRALSQAQDVYVNLKDRVVVVELREGQTIAPQVFKDLVKDAGYDVVSVETVAQSAKQIKAGVK